MDGLGHLDRALLGKLNGVFQGNGLGAVPVVRDLDVGPGHRGAASAILAVFTVLACGTLRTGRTLRALRAGGATTAARVLLQLVNAPVEIVDSAGNGAVMFPADQLVVRCHDHTVHYGGACAQGFCHVAQLPHSCCVEFITSVSDVGQAATLDRVADRKLVGLNAFRAASDSNTTVSSSSRCCSEKHHVAAGSFDAGPCNDVVGAPDLIVKAVNVVVSALHVVEPANNIVAGSRGGVHVVGAVAMTNYDIRRVEFVTVSYDDRVGGRNKSRISLTDAAVSNT
ncbi:hypothetical protein D3C81_951190 [compost metagenome]